MRRFSVGSAPVAQEPQDLVLPGAQPVHVGAQPVQITSHSCHATPELGDIGTDAGDIRPEIGDIGPDAGDIGPKIGDIGPDAGDIRPEIGDIRPELRDIRPELRDIRPELGDPTLHADQPNPVVLLRRGNPPHRRPQIAEQPVKVVEIVAELNGALRRWRRFGRRGHGGSVEPRSESAGAIGRSAAEPR